MTYIFELLLYMFFYIYALHIIHFLCGNATKKNDKKLSASADKLIITDGL